MSVGLYRHPTLGITRKYILNNKYVLEARVDAKETDEWSRQYANFKEAYLTRKTVRFYLLPEEIYIDREAAIEYEESSREPKRVIVYDHFIISLREELQNRIKLQDPYTKQQLWFLFYTFVCGAFEMIQICEAIGSAEEVDITPDTILLNQYGYVKLVGNFSMPLRQRPKLYRGTQSSLSPENFPQKQELCCATAVGRIIASLVLLKQMDNFVEGKQRVFSDAKMLEELLPHEDRLGILYNILKLMLADSLTERPIISEVKAMLLPYEDQILAMGEFTLDREISRAAMIELFINE